MTINTNNKRKIEITTEHGCLSVTHIDSKGNPEESYIISDGDVVSLLNWYNYQKRTGNDALMF